MPDGFSYHTCKSTVSKVSNNRVTTKSAWDEDRRARLDWRDEQARCNKRGNIKGRWVCIDSVHLSFLVVNNFSVNFSHQPLVLSVQPIQFYRDIFQCLLRFFLMNSRILSFQFWAYWSLGGKNATADHNVEGFFVAPERLWTIYNNSLHAHQQMS